MNLRIPQLLSILGLLGLALTAAVGASEPPTLKNGQEAFDAGRYEQALSLWRGAAEYGDIDAQVLIGIMYANGWGTPKDEAASAHWFRMAAERNSSDAQFLLAMSYLLKASDPEATREGVAWLNRAAANGDVTARGFLAKASERGWFSPPRR